MKIEIIEINEKERANLQWIVTNVTDSTLSDLSVSVLII